MTYNVKEIRKKNKHTLHVPHVGTLVLLNANAEVFDFFVPSSEFVRKCRLICPNRSVQKNEGNYKASTAKQNPSCKFKINPIFTISTTSISASILK